MLHSGDFRPRDAKLRQASSTTVRPTTRLLCTAALTLPGALLAQKVHPDEFKLKVAGIQSTADMAQAEMDATLEQDGGEDGNDFNNDPHGVDSPFEFSNS